MSNSVDIFRISRSIYNKNKTFRCFQVSSGLKIKISRKQSSYFVLMIVKMDSKNIEKYLILHYFEGVIVSRVTPWKQ